MQNTGNSRGKRFAVIDHDKTKTKEDLDKECGRLSCSGCYWGGSGHQESYLTMKIRKHVKWITMMNDVHP